MTNSAAPAGVTAGQASAAAGRAGATAGQAGATAAESGITAERRKLRARAVTETEKQDELLAGLLLGSPEFQRH